MTLPLLIVGSHKQERAKIASQLANETSSKFDIQTLDSQEANGIQAVREVISRLSKAPINSKYTSMVILELQDFTLEAQNALLKTLEEPPKRGRLIMTAPSRESVIATISSRCKTIETRQKIQIEPGLNEMQTYLSDKFFDRFANIENLDTNSWLALWRTQLIEKVVKNIPSGSGDTKKLLVYVKLILRLNRLRHKKASGKLLNTILLLQAPVTLIKN